MQRPLHCVTVPQAHEEHLKYRWQQYRGTKASILSNERSLADFARGYERYGVVKENVSTGACGC